MINDLLSAETMQAADQISTLGKTNHSPVNKNIMNLFFIHPTKKQEDEAGKHTLVPLHNQEHDTNEGSEFMDDALRTEDLPPLDAEENITEGES
jgi:hypothetical protein